MDDVRWPLPSYLQGHLRGLCHRAGAGRSLRPGPLEANPVLANHRTASETYLMLKPPGDIRFVAVTWRDAKGSASQAYEVHEMPHGPILVTTYGFLMRQDAVGISLCSEWFEDSTMRQYTFILTENLVTIEDIHIPLVKRVRKVKVVPPASVEGQSA